jgi:hypothetical protein
MNETECIEFLRAQPTYECRCSECRRLCQTSRPCWGLPEEIDRLIDEGYADRLMLDYYDGELTNYKTLYIITPAIRGCEKEKAPFFPHGRCTFFTDYEECEIHAMKPLEGRTTIHGMNGDHRKIHMTIVQLWDSDAGRRVVQRWKDKVGWIDDEW